MTIKILLIDDSFIIRSSLNKFLSQIDNFEIVGQSKNGIKAMEFIKEQQIKPNVVLCDIEMPEMDGIQTLTAIKKDYPEIKVIMLSSLTQPNSIKEKLCRQLGAYDVFGKPENYSLSMPLVEETKQKLIKSIQNSIFKK